ncbi:hypothetical protein EZV62_014051 [Acer yangbiense]|uniref:Uncharacterized protein n=1 Tax=Acer yangbiense TaxID=1000413 RepID=A0A5C7HRP3_9ROSI|nr:hypothetical protein EZV62_014051 [Acer yangbiense]
MDDSLSGDAASVDIATNENLQKLAEIGRNLLKEPVSRIDVDTGRFQNVEGEGEAKKEQKYNAATASEWGLLNWVYDNGKMPLLDVYCDASSDIVDFHVSSTLFQCFGTPGNYLRIQEDSLAGDAASMDISTMENMQKLVEIGTNLLKELVSTVDLETGRFQKIEGEGTNEEALVEFAKLQSQERKLRSLIN